MHRPEISRAQFRDSRSRYRHAHRLKFHRIKLSTGYISPRTDDEDGDDDDDEEEDQVTYGNRVNGKSACISPHRTLIQITYVWFNFLRGSHRDTPRTAIWDSGVANFANIDQREARIPLPGLPGARVEVFPLAAPFRIKSEKLSRRRKARYITVSGGSL